MGVRTRAGGDAAAAEVETGTRAPKRTGVIMFDAEVLDGGGGSTWSI